MALAAAMAAAGAALFFTVVPWEPFADAPYLIPWWVLAAGFAVFDMAVVRLNVRREAHTVTLSDVPLVFGLLLASPPALLVARTVGGAVALAAQRKPPIRVVFNLALYGLQTIVALAFVRGVLADSGGLGAWLAVMGAHVLATIVSGGLVMAAIRVTDRRSRAREIAGSMLSGFAISVGAGIVALLFLIAVRSNAWAMVVVATVMTLLYWALRLFGSLSDRHAELRSVHAFTTAIGTSDSPQALSERTVRDLAATFRADVVEIAARHVTGEGRRWIYARLQNDEYLSEPVDDEDIEGLVDEVASIGVIPISGFPSETTPRLAARGIVEGLLNGFRPNGLSGFVLVGNLERRGRDFSRDRALFETLSTQLVTNLERLALFERLRSEISLKEHDRVHDRLTGLPNRSGFIESLSGMLAEAADERLAVAVIDLDRFQEVNDVFGPDGGDLALIDVGHRLRESIRSSDIVARIGGDEFGIVFREVRGADATVALPLRIADAFSSPLVVNGIAVPMTGATGLAVAPDHGTDAETLLRRADMARSVAKAARGAVEVFDLDQDVAAERRLVLATDLPEAIAGGEIRAAFQPKVEMATGRTAGFEALARWNHPDLGPVPPTEFIQLAQHSGAISDLTDSILEQGLAQAGRWRSMGHPVPVSVNLAPAVLEEDDFADRVIAALERHRLPAEALIFELTESASLSGSRRTRDNVLRLAAAGVMMSIDDFGTGYAALSYLQNIPVGEAKIDRTFVARMAEHPGDFVIVTGIVQLLDSIGLRVVAEGVEDEETWKLLADLGCFAAQGYLMSPAVSADAAAAWLETPVWSPERAAAG